MLMFHPIKKNEYTSVFPLNCGGQKFRSNTREKKLYCTHKNPTDMKTDCYVLTILLCILKNLILCKKIMACVSRRRHIPLLNALVVMILAGESGCILGGLVLGKNKRFSLENNFKVECAIMVWLMVNYVLPRRFVLDYLFPLLDKTPFNFVYYVPHDWRRGLSLCSLIDECRCNAATCLSNVLCNDFVIFPLFVSTLSSCSKTVTLTALRSFILQNEEESGMDLKSKPFLDTILYKLKCRLICALIYSIVVYELGIQRILLWHGTLLVDPKVIIGLIFALLPIYHYLESEWRLPLVSAPFCSYSSEKSHDLILTLDIKQEEMDSVLLSGHVDVIPTLPPKFT